MNGCTELLKSRFKSFSESEKKVAEFILNDPGKILGMSIGEVALHCATSRASVVRLCKRIDCHGYKELCIKLNAEVAGCTEPDAITDHFYKDIHRDEGISDIAASVAESSIRCIRSTASNLDTESLDAAAELLCASQRIDFYGAGCSALAALDAQNKFLRIGKNCFATLDTHMQTLAATSLKQGDICVIFSGSGETKDMLEIAGIARDAGAKVISVTGRRGNSIASLSDIALYSVSGEGLVRSGAMESRIGILTVIDILYSTITARHYDAVKPKLDKSTDAMMAKKEKH